MSNHYKRLTLGERNTIENFLNQNKCAREIARSINRNISTVCYEVKNNRFISRGKYKGIPAKGVLNNYSIDIRQIHSDLFQKYHYKNGHLFAMDAKRKDMDAQEL